MCRFLAGGIRFFLSLAACLALVASAQAQAVNIADEARASRQKLTAEIAVVDSAALRAKLLQAANNQQLAHWYAGKVQVAGEWLTLETAQQRAAQDPQLATYRRQRQQMADSLNDHQRLARWCQKQKLVELAKLHWMHVLRFNNQHRAALSELKLRWHDGRLLTHNEAKQAEQRKRDQLKAKKTWQTTIKRLRHDMENGLVNEEVAARQELHAIDEPAAVPALIEEFTQPEKSAEITSARQTELMSALGNIESSRAIRTLTQYAVHSPDPSVRYAAMHQLKLKPMEKFIPSLLSDMALPIEASVSFHEVGNRIVSNYCYSQEAAGGKVYQHKTNAYHVVPGRKYLPSSITYLKQHIPSRLLREGYTTPKRTIPAHSVQCGGHMVHIAERVIPAKYHPPLLSKEKNIYHHVKTNYSDNPAYAAKKVRTERLALDQAALHQRRIAAQNIVIENQNQRIAAVLAEVTGETLEAHPQSWWNWWGNFLDQYPGVATAGARRQLNQALLNQTPRGLARGTWVWTQLGKQPIEKILPGDYVLGQDPSTGELAYRVVLAITYPRPLKVSKIDFGDTGTAAGELYCAPGHVVWTSGSGWRRVSKLEPGQSLHGVSVAARVSQVDSVFEIDSYDLIVDNCHTFFIGEAGLLVHDATPIRPTHVALPGFSPAAVAEAVQLANR